MQCVGVFIRGVGVGLKDVAMIGSRACPVPIK